MFCFFMHLFSCFCFFWKIGLVGGFLQRKPSRCRKALMFGCCADAVECARGLSASSRAPILLATRCDLVKPTEGSSRFCALLQHLQEEPEQNSAIRRRMPPVLSLHEWAGRPVPSVVWGHDPRSQPNLEFYTPTSVQYNESLRILDWEQWHFINFVTQAPS